MDGTFQIDTRFPISTQQTGPEGASMNSGLLPTRTYVSSDQRNDSDDDTVAPLGVDPYASRAFHRSRTYCATRR